MTDAAAAETVADEVDRAMIAVDQAAINGEDHAAINAEEVVDQDSVRIVVVNDAAAEVPVEKEIDAVAAEAAAAIDEEVEIGAAVEIVLSVGVMIDLRRSALVRMSRRRESKQRSSRPVPLSKVSPSTSGIPGECFPFPIWPRSFCKAGIVTNSSCKRKKASRCFAARRTAHSG